MNKLASLAIGVVASLVAAGAAPGGASAADLAPPALAVEPAAPSRFDIAFGVAGVTDYRFRGISNSSKNPAVQGYVELQAFDWVYAGMWASSVRFPAAWQRNSSGTEIDFYGGLRHGWGPVTLDVGGLYYYYGGSKTVIPVLGRRRFEYWEVYAKPTVAIGDLGAVSGNLYWTTDFMNLGGDALYLSIIPKIGVPLAAFPDLGFYVSAELGKQWIGKSSKGAVNYNWRDYLAWNIGGGVTYKAVTFDLRYSDTDLSRRDCAFNYNHTSLCGSAVVAKISFDASLGRLK